MRLRLRCHMNKIHFTILFSFLTFSIVFSAEEYYTPADFGFRLTDHGYVDLSYHPPGVVMGNFNPDDYPDIARIQGKCLEVYLNINGRYGKQPTYTKYYDQHLINIRCEGEVWLDYWDIIVTQANGKEDRIVNHYGIFDFYQKVNFATFSQFAHTINQLSFSVVWQTESMNYGMAPNTVGDLDNDGIVELVTYYKETEMADTAWMLIYKCIANNQYELYMMEPFFTELQNNGLSCLKITDIDQNGDKELLFSADKLYFWEFSAPGNYMVYEGPYLSYGYTVKSIEIGDINNNNLLELIILEVNNFTPQQSIYNIYEYSSKIGLCMYFNIVSSLILDWPVSQFALGDFDNDGATDIVNGCSGFIGTGPVDISYFRYDTSEVQNFSHNWLYTGIPSQCVNPEIGDFDNDGDNELFSSGFILGSGSNFIYESLGFNNGYISWWDTTTMINGPNGSHFGTVNGHPAVIIVDFIPAIWKGQLVLWYFEDLNNIESWLSNQVDSLRFTCPNLYDMDSDGREDIIVSEMWYNFIQVWENNNSYIQEDTGLNKQGLINLFPNYPNPFNSSTLISFYLMIESQIELTLYNNIGQKVMILENGVKEPGLNSFALDARDLAAGVYFININIRNLQYSQKCILLK